MVSDVGVPSLELHITLLTLTGIEEDALVLPTIFIAVLFATLAGEDEYKLAVLWRRDAALSLPTEDVVNVFSARVFHSFNKHAAPNLDHYSV